jgi:hypothetical protein
MSGYTIQRSGERGRADHGWLQSRFSFSFADYVNPEKMGFGALRVINDDTILPGGSFPMHPHRDMEIITIITQGAIEHTDSMGNRSTLQAGEVQHMSAGTGIRHAEANPYDSVLELFQIWIYPKSNGIEPNYQQTIFDPAHTRNRLGVLVSGNGAEGSLPIHQEARILRGIFEKAGTVNVAAQTPGNGLYLFVVEGEADVLGETLKRRDAMGIETPGSLTLDLKAGTDLLVFDVPMTH